MKILGRKLKRKLFQLFGSGYKHRQDSNPQTSFTSSGALKVTQLLLPRDKNLGRRHESRPVRICFLWFIKIQNSKFHCGMYYKNLRSVTDDYRSVIDNCEWRSKLWHHGYDHNWWHWLRLGHNYSTGIIHDDRNIFTAQANDTNPINPSCLFRQLS
jgi:hypothetical protein